jgi:arsenate reductase (thioredoxin)
VAERRRVLFVCPRGAGPSRIAAAYMDHLAGDRYEALSAGLQPADQPHREAVSTMAEAGIVVADEPATLLTSDLAASAHRIIGMGCAVAEACPALTVPLEDWGIPDTTGRPPPEARVIRDTIRRLVERLVARLDAEAAVG